MLATQTHNHCDSCDTITKVLVKQEIRRPAKSKNKAVKTNLTMNRDKGGGAHQLNHDIILKHLHSVDHHIVDFHVML